MLGMLMQIGDREAKSTNQTNRHISDCQTRGLARGALSPRRRQCITIALAYSLEFVTV